MDKVLREAGSFVGVLLGIILIIGLLVGWTMVNMALIALLAAYWGVKIAGGLLWFLGVLTTIGGIVWNLGK